MTDESEGAELVTVEFVGGPEDGNRDLYAAVDGDPPERIGRTVEATGETAWYKHQGGHSVRDDWTYTFQWDHTDPPLQLPHHERG